MSTIILGDSILNCSSLVSKEKFINIFKKKITTNNLPIKKIKFYGIDGATSSKALKFFNKIKKLNEFNLLIFQFGLNDSWHFKSLKGKPNVEKQTFKSNLKKIIFKFINSDKKKVILLTYHTVLKDRLEVNKKTINHNIHNYNQIIRSFSNKKKNIIILDINKKLKKISPKKICLPYPDEVHINYKGAKIYSDIMFKTIKKIIQ